MNKIKKFSIKPVNGFNTLHQDNTPAHCPFRNPVILPPTIQGAPPQISIPACNDQCLFFKHVNPFEVSLQCTDTILTIEPYEQT